jgi:molybdopterin molybdotransferase
VISVEEALSRILTFVNALEGEEKNLLDCLGQVLDEDVYAPFDVPPQDNSAMDGYAMQLASIEGASDEHPRILRVVGEIAAGSVPKVSVVAGTSVRIMTGATLPPGADVVIPFEATDEVERRKTLLPNSEIGIRLTLPLGANIRRSGEDITKGELVMKRGRVLRPADIGVLASLGRAKVRVIRRPTVGILATGDEVLDVNQPLLPGKIYNSNSYGLAAQVLGCGGIPSLLGIAPDNAGQLSKAIRRGLDCDMLITSGGVSLGDYDMVKQVLAAEGDISFWTVCMKPGKPLAFGTFKRDSGKKVPHLGLPGNPVSSMITFEVFARPAIYKMMGKNAFTRSVIRAKIEEPLRNNDGRRVFARVIVDSREGEYFAKLTGSQGSGILTSMANANGLAVIPETTEKVEPGDAVEVVMLDWNEFQVGKVAY